MTTITDTGHRINTEPELEFTELIDQPKLSAAAILGNLVSWISADLKTPVFDKAKGRKNASEFEAACIRRDALQEVLAWMERLGAVDFDG